MKTLKETYPPELLDSYSDDENLKELNKFIKERTPYQLLGIVSDATTADAKRAKIDLLRIYHSDKTQKVTTAGNAICAGINNAFEKISVANESAAKRVPFNQGSAPEPAESAEEKEKLHTDCNRLYQDLIGEVDKARGFFTPFLFCNCFPHGSFNLDDPKFRRFMEGKTKGNCSLDHYKKILSVFELKKRQFICWKNVSGSIIWNAQLAHFQRDIQTSTSIQEVNELEKAIRDEAQNIKAQKKQLNEYHKELSELLSNISRIFTVLHLGKDLSAGQKTALANLTSRVNDVADCDQYTTLKGELSGIIQVAKRLEQIHLAGMNYLAKRYLSTYLISAGLGALVEWISPLRYFKVKATLALLDKIKGNNELPKNAEQVKQVEINLKNDVSNLTQEVANAVTRYKSQISHEPHSDAGLSAPEDGEFSKAFKPR